MLLTKRNLAIAEVCDKERPHDYTGGLHITPNETVATDGKMLIRVGYNGMPSADYPAIDGFTMAEPCELTIDAESAIGIAKSIPKSRIPILEHAAIGARVNGNVALVTTDLERPKTIMAKVIEVKYPDVNKVMPSKEGATSVSLNANLLIRLLKHMQYDKSCSIIKIYVNDAVSPVLIESGCIEQSITGVIMPLKS